MTVSLTPISVQVGWKHEKAVAELEAKRLAKALKYYEAKKKLIAMRRKAEEQVKA
jgi:large subunit ribosomal protein L13Ae